MTSRRGRPDLVRDDGEEAGAGADWPGIDGKAEGTTGSDEGPGVPKDAGGTGGKEDIRGDRQDATTEGADDSGEDSIRVDRWGGMILQGDNGSTTSLYQFSTTAQRLTPSTSFTSATSLDTRRLTSLITSEAEIVTITLQPQATRLETRISSTQSNSDLRHLP